MDCNEEVFAENYYLITYFVSEWEYLMSFVVSVVLALLRGLKRKS